VVNRIEGWVHATPKPTRLLASVGGESDPSSEQRTVRIAVLHSRSAAAATVCLIVNVVAVVCRGIASYLWLMLIVLARSPRHARPCLRFRKL
jgi:hypothetical protein